MIDQHSARKERVYLTGFMGSGKSTIGPILANTIGYDFIDVDRSVETSMGKTVNQIFREHGEEHFRVLERTLIAQMSTRPHIVVSLGGGTIADPENFGVIRATGILVYLKTTPEQLFRRLHHKSDRPVLRTEEGEQLPEGELRARILDLYKRREPLYAKADIVVHTDEVKVGKTVDLIVRKLSHFIE
jgi:shikimate kinase